ncbi:EamA family transporter [Rhodovulum sulfidophilum]|uniref:EamA family transporter n=1 Tax=Rhodovulum sulfidophilum TaxID=35806 RepID=UPI00138A01F6|nr:DMT family transporter [Rhodovulum sulfidophilum]
MQRLIFSAQIVIFSLIWSSAFIAGSVAIKDFDPFTLLVLRFALSALVLLPFGWVGHSLFDVEVVRHGLMLGLLNNAVYLGLSFSALRLIRPEVVIVIISSAPFVATFAATRLGLEPLSKRIIGGIMLGFVGVLVISGIATSEPPNIWGLFLATFGMLAFVAGTIIFRKKSSGLPILQTNFWQSVAGAVALLPLAAVSGHPIGAPSGQALFALLYLVFVVTIGGMALWLLLIRTSGASSASSYHLLNPFFGVLLAHLVLGESVRTTDFIGAVLIGIGLILTTAKRGENHVRKQPYLRRHVR